MDFIEQVIFSCEQGLREILMAELAAIGYDSFQETDDGFITFNEQTIDQNLLDELTSRYQEQGTVSYKIGRIARENWNKKWEGSYQPIVISNRCIVRASFHKPQSNFEIDIVINPKMSFGTGHHETTSLIMAAQLEINHENKSVLDAGCGTGILSILAGKLGASSLTAFDIDKSIFTITQENFIINKIEGSILSGTVSVLKFSQDYDIILANINKNILLHDIPGYQKLLNPEGLLLLSGFYQSDLSEIELKAIDSGLKFVSSTAKNNWAMALFQMK